MIKVYHKKTKIQDFCVVCIFAKSTLKILHFCTRNDIMSEKGELVMYLPGTPNDLIGDLRRNMGISQSELSKKIGITASQISRIESGYIENISSAILIKLAKEFKVSTDYILGLSTISTPKNRDISELGLSDGAATALLKGRYETQTLNRLLEHKSFPNLVKLIKIYFEDTRVAGIKGRNEIIDMAVMALGDFKKEAKDDIAILKSQKLGDHEAEIEKIKNNFMSILRDIKKDMENNEPTGETATADMMKKIQAELAKNPRKNVTAEDMADAIVAAANQTTALDEKTAKQFRQLTLGLLKKKRK